MDDGRSRSDRTRYRFGPLEQRGLIAGWRAGQIASVAGGLVGAVLALRSSPSISGVVIALCATGGGMAMACWPIRGRTGDQWAPLVARWAISTLRTGRTRSAAGPTGGTVVRSAPDGSVAVDGPGGRGHGSGGWGFRLPAGVFDGLSIVGRPLPGAGGDPLAGVVLDARSRTATAVLAVRGHSFALLGHTDQDARIGAWARVLAALAREGSAVHRVQWVESCLPDDGVGTRNDRLHRAVMSPDSDPVRSYDALVHQSAPVTRRHRVLLALTIDTARSARAIRAAGGGERGAGTVLLREVASLQHLLGDADVTVEGLLGPEALASVFRQSSATMAAVAGAGADSDDEATSATWPWPLIMATEWDAVRTDATWHATYWVAEWPRIEVTPDFLGPLLFSPLRRSIAMVMEPMSPVRAARQVAQARTADIADGELRRRGGFLVTARQRREQEGVEHRDTELADGHAQYRFSGYVTVTADDRDSLREGCAAMEQAAGQARMDLRRLYGEQDVAFACTMPLGRGLA